MDNIETALERMKPSLHLDIEDLPAMKDWEVGKTYTVTMVIKQTSKNEHQQEFGKNKGKVRRSGSFEIQSIKPVNGPSKTSLKDTKKYIADEKRKAASY